MKKFVLVFFLAVWMMAPLNVSAADKTAPVSQDALGERQTQIFCHGFVLPDAHPE